MNDALSRSKDEFMTAEEYRLLCDLLNGETGIALKGDKRLTLHTKISHRLGILGIATYGEYLEHIAADSTGKELGILVSHIMNHETCFFRERPQLDAFSLLLEGIKRGKQAKGDNRVRVLSLACSSGEEPYTLNILLQESGFFLWNWDLRVTGIDIDRSAIERAEAGCYTKNSLRMIEDDKELVSRYFLSEGDRFVVRKFYTRNVEFREGNIVDPGTFSDLEKADVVFCRNVFIYMDDDTIGKVAANIHSCLSDSGYLFIGSAETLIQKTDLLVPEYNEGIIVYRKRCAP